MAAGSRLSLNALKQRLLPLLRLAFLLTLLPGCYLARVGWQHNSLYNTRRPVFELAATSEDAALRQRLAFTEDVKNYALAHGLPAQGTYESLVDDRGRVLSYIVSAAKPLRLAAHTWWFPIVGEVPYLGFASEVERDVYAQSLEAKGFDVYRSEAAAFSGLGWYEEPLTTSMLQRSPESLAGLLFHELTHRRFWWPGETAFNEQLASFVEDVMTRNYLQARGFVRAAKRWRQRQQDHRLYQRWLERFMVQLTTLYNSSTCSVQAKRALFAEATMAQRPLFQRYDFVGDEPWNNATVLARKLYAPETELFACVLRRLGSFKSFFAYLDSLPQNKTPGPFAALRRLCATEVSA